MIKYLKQYTDKTFEELVNSLIWFDNPLKLKAIFTKLYNLVLLNGVNYKTYTALLTQEGLNAPTAKILENTLGNVTFSYIDVGRYTINSSGLFPVTKTTVSLTAPTDEENRSVVFKYDTRTDGTIEFRTLDINRDPADVFQNGSLEIKVYS